MEKLRDENGIMLRNSRPALVCSSSFWVPVDPLSAQKGTGDAVDHLAFDPGSSVILAIECTVGPPDARGKLSKLIARSEDVRTNCLTAR